MGNVAPRYLHAASCAHMIRKYPIKYGIIGLSAMLAGLVLIHGVREYTHAAMPETPIVRAYCAEATPGETHNFTILVNSQPSHLCMRVSAYSLQITGETEPLFLSASGSVNGYGAGVAGRYRVGSTVRHGVAGPGILHTRYFYVCPFLGVLDRPYMDVLPDQDIIIKPGETTFRVFSKTLPVPFTCGKVTVPAGPVEERYLATDHERGNPIIQ